MFTKLVEVLFFCELCRKQPFTCTIRKILPNSLKNMSTENNLIYFSAACDYFHFQ